MNRVYVKCFGCGKKVEKYPSQIKKAPQGKLFCSIECYRKNRKSEANPNWRGKTENRICKMCGSDFLHIPRVGRENRGQYCSVECKNRSIKGMGKIQSMSDLDARKLFDQYCNGSLSLDAFAFQKEISPSALRKLFKTRWPDELSHMIDKHRAAINITYRRGRQFEYATMRDLEKKGYWCLRSPASKGVADVVAIKTGEILLVQCKSGNGKLPKNERMGLVDEALSIGAIPLLACRPKRGEIKYMKCSIRYQDMEEWNANTCN